MNIFAFIFARGGSKGVPRKNLLKINNKSLLMHSIDIAKSINQISKIYVSTDDAEIADEAIKAGVDVIKRPAYLANDESPEWLAWRHAIEYLAGMGVQFDVFVSLPTTSPLRVAADVEECIASLDDETDIVVTIQETSRSPWFNMVKMDGQFLQRLINSSEIFSRRQDAPKGYDMSTVAYVSRPSYILEKEGIFSGNVKGCLIPSERAIDIDTTLDFLIAQFLMERNINAT